MIDGLKVTIPGAELLMLCNDRIAMYKDRAEKARLKLNELGNSFSNDASESLRRLRTSDNQVQQLEFIAKYLDTAETYRLGEDDLRVLGLKTHGYYED